MNSKRLAVAAFLLPALFWNPALGGEEGQSGRRSPTRPSASRLYIPPSCQGRPLVASPPHTASEAPPSPKKNLPLTNSQQLNVLRQLVTRVNQVYVYPDFNGRDWPAMVARYRAKVESGLETDDFYAEMKKLVSELGDEHSYFESPVDVAEDEARLAGTREYVGVGVLLQPLAGKNRVTILAVFPDSSAAYGGLKPHDDILAVDGLPLIENAKPFPYRVLGPECSTAVFTVQSPGRQPRQMTLVRHRLAGGLPIDARRVPTRDGSRLGYIFLPTFFDKTIPEQVRAALEAFGPLDGLILDNRMNGGGSSLVLKPILGYFTSGTLGHYLSRTARRPLEITPTPIHNSQTVPLVILVSQNTVSYGEVFSGVLRDAGRAQIVGHVTRGNVETLHGYRFDDGSQLWIAQERFDPLRSHADWEKSGVKPDVEVNADWDAVTFESDPVVAAAVKLLGHK